MDSELNKKNENIDEQILMFYFLNSYKENYEDNNIIKLVENIKYNLNKVSSFSFNYLVWAINIFKELNTDNFDIYFTLNDIKIICNEIIKKIEYFDQNQIISLIFSTSELLVLEEDFMKIFIEKIIKQKLMNFDEKINIENTKHFTNFLMLLYKLKIKTKFI